MNTHKIKIISTLYFRFKQAKKVVRNKTVFGSKLKKRKFKNTTPVRDKDITHFTAYVLQKHTRVIRKKYAQKYEFVLQDMAWGTKYIFFKSGEKVKVGNSVLEAVKTAIIRDYKKATILYNQECDSEAKIRIFSKNTYLKWLRVKHEYRPP